VPHYYTDTNGKLHGVYQSQVEEDATENAWLSSGVVSAYQALLNDRYKNASGVILVDFSTEDFAKPMKKKTLYHNVRKHNDDARNYFGVYLTGGRVRDHWVVLGVSLALNTVYYGDSIYGANEAFTRPELLRQFKKNFVAPLLAYRNQPLSKPMNDEFVDVDEYYE